jgi:hypothetical protein
MSTKKLADYDLVPLGMSANRLDESVVMTRRRFDRGELEGIRTANGERLVFRDSLEACMQRKAAAASNGRRGVTG